MGEIVRMELDENLGITSFVTFLTVPARHFNQIIVHHRAVPQSCHLVPHLSVCLSFAPTTMIVQSARSVGFGMLIELISYGANFMLIGTQETISLINRGQFH